MLKSVRSANNKDISLKSNSNYVCLTKWKWKIMRNALSIILIITNMLTNVRNALWINIMTETQWAARVRKPFQFVLLTSLCIAQKNSLVSNAQKISLFMIHTTIFAFSAQKRSLFIINNCGNAKKVKKAYQHPQLLQYRQQRKTLKLKMLVSISIQQFMNRYRLVQIPIKMS